AYRAALGASDNTNPVAWNGIGLVLAELGRNQEARTAYARAIESRPRYAEAHYNLSFVLSNLGDTEGALRENKIAIEIEPYYVQQRFELALDLEIGDPGLTVDTDLGADRRAETVDAFAFDASVLDSLFTELQPPETAAARAEDPFAVATDFMARGWWGEAL